ncbi:hypothetical protein [Streptomyces regalis]|uniref:Uncharacterized protein n=1 Tax=Streptomyces regalis TaxID=68262 RepID=A0A101J8A7_9ACTN|nr:hypothetical protein [Streptomyces regalis]KUL22080.1 hypothetical protein ADL12_43360 [Streptomyces regalis]
MSVLTYLLALPHHTRVTLRALASPSVEKRAGIVAALRELEERRYLRRVVRDGRGDGAAGQLSVVYEVFDAPYEAAPRTGETKKVPGRAASPGRRTAAAVRLLLLLGEYDRRLTLDGAEARRLAPLVEEWWRRGASSAQVRAAVTGGWPRWAGSAYGHIEARLRDGLHRRVAPTGVPVGAVEVDFRRRRGFAWRFLREKWSVFDDRRTRAA